MRTLYTASEIASRVAELAAQIAADHNGKPLLVLGVLKGSLIFLADLVRRLNLPLRYELIALSSYRNNTDPGELLVYGELPQSEPGEEVLIVEDIVDTGGTMARLTELLERHYGQSAKICALLDKRTRRNHHTVVDYAGFRLDSDDFVVGYGLDYDGRYRNLPYIGVLEDDEL
jgi:hypoxanthine phosphoribosyltransferase